MDSNLLPMDVYCGKDRTLENNEGNKIYRQLIVENVSLYNSIKEKRDKMKMTAYILQEFKRRSNNGAFKRLDQNNGWIACTQDKVRDKISHALRDPVKKRCSGTSLPRRNSMYTTNDGRAIKNNGSPSQLLQKRPRGDSVASCPAAIETASMQPLVLDESLQDHNDVDISISTDALIMWEEMISSGKLDKFDERSWIRHDNSQDEATASTIGSGSEQTSFEIPDIFDNIHDNGSRQILRDAIDTHLFK
jgi:hypothetical protein